MPEEVGVLVGSSGVDIVSPRTLMPIVHWPWSLITGFSGRKESDDPTDMELFMLTHKYHGEYVFECDEYRVIDMAFKKGQMQASQTSKKLKHWIL